MRRSTLYALLAMSGIAGSLAIAEIMARLEAWRPAALAWPAARPADAGILVVVGRGRERAYEDETTVPFRGSRLGIYRRDMAGGAASADQWTLTAGPFPCRSESTAVGRPQSGDIATYVKEQAAGTSGTIPYGWCSVPLGFRRLTPADKDGSPAYLVTDWGRASGAIALPEPMTVRGRWIEVPPGLDMGAIRFVEPPVPDRILWVRQDKGSCFIHPSVTKFWSHRDSQGCIGLYQPKTKKGAPPGMDASGDFAMFHAAMGAALDLDRKSRPGASGGPEEQFPIGLLIEPLGKVVDDGTTDSLRRIFTFDPGKWSK